MSIKKIKLMLSVFFIISVVKLNSEIKTVLFYSESFVDFSATHRIDLDLRLTLFVLYTMLAVGNYSR